MPSHVPDRSSDVSAASLPNAGASATIPSSPKSFPVAIVHSHTYTRHTNATTSPPRTIASTRPRSLSAASAATYRIDTAMSAPLTCPTPVPVPPCPQHQRSLQPASTVIHTHDHQHTTLIVHHRLPHTPTQPSSANAPATPIPPHAQPRTGQIQ